MQLEQGFGDASGRELAATEEATVEAANALVGTGLILELDVDFALRKVSEIRR